MEWTLIIVATIPVVGTIIGVLFNHNGKKAELNNKKYEQLEAKIQSQDEKMVRQDERIERLEARLNDETRERRKEQNFSHLLVMDAYTAIQVLEVMKVALERYADIIPGGFPTIEEVQDVIDKLRATIAARPGFASN